MRIHVTKLSGEQIFGSLNIGKLQKTNIIHKNGEPIFKMKNGDLVFCSFEMFDRINQRLEVLCFG